MERKSLRTERGATLIRSIFLFALGLLCIPLGMTFLPVIGILVGGVLMAFAVYPYLTFFKLNTVRIRVGVVTTNNLGSMRLPVAILSASRERDGFDFDPRRIDPTSVRFGPHKAAPDEDMSDPKVWKRNLVDLNQDGIPDLMLYFSGDTAGITASTREACIRARTIDGERVFGCGKPEYGYDSGFNAELEYK